MDADTNQQIEELMSRILKRKAAIDRDFDRIHRIIAEMPEPSEDKGYFPFMAYRSLIPRGGFLILLIVVATIAVFFTLFSEVPTAIIP